MLADSDVIRFQPYKVIPIKRKNKTGWGFTFCVAIQNAHNDSIFYSVAMYLNVYVTRAEAKYHMHQDTYQWTKDMIVQRRRKEAMKAVAVES